MTTPLNHHEEEFIKQIVEAGYKNSARAFSALSNTEVSIDSMYLRFINKPDSLQSLLPSNQSLVVLTTDMIGDLKGKSYLIFTEAESKKLVKVCSPFKTGNNTLELEDAILMEIDNIVSAAVITEVSNKLNLKIYGDVPILQKIDRKEILDILNRDFSHHQPNEHDILLISSTHFHFKNVTDLRPQFVWKFNPHILKIIKEHALLHRTV